MALCFHTFFVRWDPQNGDPIDHPNEATVPDYQEFHALRERLIELEKEVERLSRRCV